jgi:hypothetical protein
VGPDVMGAVIIGSIAAVISPIGFAFFIHFFFVFCLTNFLRCQTVGYDSRNIHVPDDGVKEKKRIERSNQRVQICFSRLFITGMGMFMAYSMYQHMDFDESDPENSNIDDYMQVIHR